MRNHKTEITKLSLLAAAQASLFVLVYLATIAVGAGLIYFAVRGSIWLVPLFFEKIAPEVMGIGRSGIFFVTGIVVAFAGLLASVIAVGVMLFKSLFSPPNRKRIIGKEIRREDSPRLYDMIMETAAAVGVKMPKHIYVDHRVNASVFFNAGFWNMFIPVRKNLAIGLGLFSSTNVDEVRSIIAHEFGHFAKGSVRIGPHLYVAQSVFYTLVSHRDRLDHFMVRWSMCGGFTGFWGKGVQWVVVRFRNLLEAMFRRQENDFNKLSRLMEYDADTVACRLVGQEFFTSALCKIQQNDVAFRAYDCILDGMAAEGQIIEDYWEGYDRAASKMRTVGYVISSYDKLESKPEQEMPASRLVIEEVWSMHPTVEKRIEHAKSVESCGHKPAAMVSAWELVSDKLKSGISGWLMDMMKEQNRISRQVDWREFDEIISQRLDNLFFQKEVEVFFARDIIATETTELDEDVLSESNRRTVMAFVQACHDMDALFAMMNGRLSVKYFMYDGKRRRIDDLPLKEHHKYLEQLEGQVRRIDGAIRALAVSREEIPGLIDAAYEVIFHVQDFLERMSEEFLSERDYIIRELEAKNISGYNEYKALKDMLESYEAALKDMLRSLDYGPLKHFFSKGDYDQMVNYFTTSRSSFSDGIDGEDVHRLFMMTEVIMAVHSNMCHCAKMVVANTLLNKPIPDVEFLRCWKTESVAEEMADA